MSSPVVVQPDLEAWVWQQIGGLESGGQAGGVTCWDYSATQVFPGWVYAHHLQVDARARTKPMARALAEQVRQIMSGLCEVPWPEGVVAMVQPTDGPFYLPDPDGLPRYVTRYEVRVHPLRSSASLTTPVAHPPRRRSAASQ